MAGLLLSCALPIYFFTPMNPLGPYIALAGTMIAFPVKAFARRYLHGEFIYAKFAVLSTCLLLGFNIVATAPSLYVLLGGWTLIGFSSTFLIGSYNERSTVRNNATFAFTVY
jgi:NADH:ubiquinone oxidoreductase subunit 5 (subunit L)/multisubunit Na+/H+ antiporter MnhA subunit